jgi:hypothetical protein
LLKDLPSCFVFVRSVVWCLRPCSWPFFAVRVKQFLEKCFETFQGRPQLRERLFKRIVLYFELFTCCWLRADFNKVFGRNVDRWC